VHFKKLHGLRLGRHKQTFFSKKATTRIAFKTKAYLKILPFAFKEFFNSDRAQEESMRPFTKLELIQ